MDFETHKREFKEQGFTIVRNALSQRELADLEDAALNVVKDHPSASGEDYLREGNIMERDPGFWFLMDHPKTYPLITQLLSPHSRIMSAELIRRTGQGQDDPVDWHDDGPACPSYRELATPAPLMQLKVGYFLEDCLDDQSGNLVVVPGSHLFPEGPPDDLPHGLQHPEAVAVKLHKGDAILFHNALWHCVLQATKPKLRMNIYVGYCYAWMAPFDRSASSLYLRNALSGERRRLLGDFDEPDTNWELVRKVFRGSPELVALGLSGRLATLAKRRLKKAKRKILGENLY